MSNKSKTVTITGLNETLIQFSRVVASMSPSAVSFFNRLYLGNDDKKDKTKAPTKFNDDMSFSNVKAVIDSTAEPLERAKRLVTFVRRIEEQIKQFKEKEKIFEHSDKEKAKIKEWLESQFRSTIDSCLLLHDALKLNIFDEIKDSDFHLDAQKFVNFYLQWKFELNLTIKLPEFITSDLEFDDNLLNIAFNQQLGGKIPVSPICQQILPFSLLEWQKKMFTLLRQQNNVIVCAPTSSGKTMVALGYIISFLKNEYKSLLVYIVPNEVLAIEIAALLNKYVPDRVSTILNNRTDRKQDERVVVCTPWGAFWSKFYNTNLPENALLVIDEVHCISNYGGRHIEYILRRMSKVQTLLLSATMTEETIQKLEGCIRASNPRQTHIVNEKTRFIIPQYMVTKNDDDGGIKLGSVNPIGSITAEDLENPNLDISMTPRDILAFFVKIIKTFGINQTPEYLHPLRFFYIFNCNIPTEYRMLNELEEENEEDEEDEDEEDEDQITNTFKPETGLVSRLSIEEITKWQRALMDFIVSKKQTIEGKEKVQSILDSFKSSMTDDSTAECNRDNAFKLVEQLKENNMLQAIFFFPTIYSAIQYATHIFKQLSSKPLSSKDDKMNKDREAQIEALRKQLSSLEKLKPGKGFDVKDLKERKYQLIQNIQNLASSAASISAEHSLNPDKIICNENFDKFFSNLKKWNSNINLNHPLAQMVIYGIGILSGEMPYELQCNVRELYHTGSISLLMTTDDSAYGINTPTRTVILSKGFTETQRRQMGGRAGRKGLTTDAWIVYFKLDNIEDAGQKLKTLQGENATFYSARELPKQKHWITNFNQPRKIYNISIDQRDVLENNFFPMTKLMYEHAATLGPIILTEAIRATRGTTNRHIRVILSLLPVTPFNYPFSQKEGWIYDLPNEVKKIYKDNDLEEPIPNYTLYMWLTNQIEEIGTEDLEKIVENAKKWSYLFFLLKNNGNDFFMFKENGKDVSEENLYKQIQELLTSCLIRTSTNF